MYITICIYMHTQKEDCYLPIKSRHFLANISFKSRHLEYAILGKKRRFQSWQNKSTKNQLEKFTSKFRVGFRLQIRPTRWPTTPSWGWGRSPSPGPGPAARPDPAQGPPGTRPGPMGPAQARGPNHSKSKLGQASRLERNPKNQ